MDAPPVLLRYLLQAASLLVPWSAELRAVNMAQSRTSLRSRPDMSYWRYFPSRNVN